MRLAFLLISMALMACGDNRYDPVMPEVAPEIEIPTPENPEVSEAISGPGQAFVAGTQALDLAAVHYGQAEYFYSGSAESYSNVNEFAEDGRWQVEAADSAEYKTRILVYAPLDPEDFSGVAVLEWLNVSAGLDSAPDWSILHTELIRNGHVWVGVSAQIVGVEGGGSFPFHLKGVNPDRYGELLHPGDSFAYDIFSQAAQAVRTPLAVKPLGELQADTLIAVGESQSAGFMLTYVNAFAPLYRVFDAYLIHSRLGSSAPLSQEPQAPVKSPPVVQVRSDLEAPVLMFQTETDVLLLDSLSSRQDDSGKFRLWEVAGTAHGDVYSLLLSNADQGDDPSVANVVEVDEPVPGFIQCDSPINSGPQHWVVKAGFRGLLRWAQGGEPLPVAPRLQVSDNQESFVLDDHGNVLGGIRTPYVDAPVAVLSGLGQSGESFCRIFGTTRLFDEATLAALYPTHADYAAAVAESLDTAVNAGFILPEDAELITAAAESSEIGGG